MILIYGAISFNSKIDPGKIESLKGNLKCSTSESFELKWNNFTGGFFYNPIPHFNAADFFYLDEKNEILVLLAGHIYKYDDTGQLFQTKAKINTPELIAGLFLQFGDNFVNYLNGDFAVFIYQKNRNKIYLYRDHLGIHPLGFTQYNNSLYFCSDLLMLCKTFYKEIPIKRSYLNQFLQNPDFINYRVLPSDNIKKVSPGFYIIWSSDGLEEKKYWYPEKIRTNKNLSFNAVKNELKFLVEDAVKIKCDTRFFASSHLSGGLDSSLVSVLVLKMYNKQPVFYGLSWASENTTAQIEQEYDERIRIRELARAYGIKPVFCDYSEKEFIKYLSVWFYYSFLIDEHKVLGKCNELGINLVFSGWGGDEFLSIDNAGIDFDLFFGLHWKSFFQRNPLLKPKKLIRRLVFNVLFPLFGLNKYYNSSNGKWRNKYFQFPFNKTSFLKRQNIYFKSRKKAHLSYLYNYHIPWRTETWAILGYRNNVDYRYPLLDRRIIEYMLTIPSKLIYNKKYYRFIIRNISEGVLPDSIRLNLLKYDGSQDNKYERLLKESSAYLINQIEMIQKNPEFDFINFNSLKEDIVKYKQGNYGNNEIEFLNFLSCLYQMHEFTKGYHN